MKFRFVVAAAVLFSLISTIQAMAQTQPLTSLIACRAINQAAERLACFDASAAVLGDAINNNGLVVMDKSEVRNTRRSLFGYALPKIALFGNKGTGGEDIETIETTVAGFRSIGYGLWAFTTADGASWQTTEAGRDEPAKNQKIMIKRAALGSYFVRFDRGRLIRARRTQ
jgi:hypothetical protein